MKNIIEDFSLILSQDPKSCIVNSGVECNQGWHDIIYQTCKELNSYKECKKIDLKITRIKEKFAALRIYYEGGDDYVSGVVNLAERISMITCEVCGSFSGRIRSNGYWLKTLCDNDAQKLEYTKEHRS